MNFEEWKDRELAKGKQMTWLEWCEKAFEAGQQSKEAAIKEMDEVIKMQDADLRKYEKQIESLREQLNNMEACYIEKKKEVEALQKRIDEYEKLTTSIRNEFDLWSEDSEFAGVIEAQIENLEALRGGHE